MDTHELVRRFATLTTAHLADACLRAKAPVRCVPPPMRPVGAAARLSGRALPARHVGSVDVFLEAFEQAEPGDVLVVDNGGRVDEACVGDLVVLEAQLAGLQGVVIWGLHRDTADIQAIGLPVFSQGSLSTGPLRLDPRPADALSAAGFGPWTVTTEDVVFADEDGVLFAPADRVAELLSLAERIRDTERRQAERIRAGASLRAQLGFDGFLLARQRNPELTFRDHLREVGGAIEE